MEEFALLDFQFGTRVYHVWTGPSADSFSSLIPEAASALYNPIPHIDIRPLRAGVSSGWPSIQIQTALPAGHVIDTALRNQAANWSLSLRIVSDLSTKPAVVADTVFLGDAVQHEKADGLWTIRAEHYLNRLDDAVPEPAMGALEHQRNTPGDLGFSLMEQSAAFLDRWNP